MRTTPSGQLARLELQGGFSLTYDGERWDLPLSGQRVLAFLAVHDRPLLRAYVAGALWPGSSEPRAAASLRTAVWRVHRPPGSPLAVTGSQLALAEDLAVDVRETRAAARRILSGSETEEAEHGLVERLVYARDLLPDWYDEWALMEREQLREQRIRALERLCEQLTNASQFAEAAQAGLAAAACEPLRESSQRALIRLHIAEGNEGEALRRYSEYSALLERKLRLAPSPRMEALVAPLTCRRLAPRAAGHAHGASDC